MIIDFLSADEINILTSKGVYDRNGQHYKMVKGQIYRIPQEAIGTPAELSLADKGNPNGWENVLVWVANYIIACYDEDGHEIFVCDNGKRRYHYSTRETAMQAIKNVIEYVSAVQCAKLYRRRRAVGYRWIATYFRGGTHLTSWGE